MKMTKESLKLLASPRNLRNHNIHTNPISLTKIHLPRDKKILLLKKKNILKLLQKLILMNEIHSKIKFNLQMKSKFLSLLFKLLKMIRPLLLQKLIKKKKI